MLTQEQLELRKKFIGGSDIAAILGISSYKSAYDVWLEKTTGESKDISNLPHIKMGNILEPIIREHAERKYNKKFPPILVRHPTLDFCAANLDGLSDDGVVLEIKTVGVAKSYMLPDEYRAQIMWQMIASGARSAIYVSYYKEHDDYFYKEVEFDEQEAAHMIEVAAQFWAKVKSGVWLDIPKKMLDMVSEWEQLKQARDAAQTAFDVVDEQLKDEFLKLNMEEVMVGGHKMSLIERKGAVDYGAIDALKTINLEQFRKPSTKYVKIG